MVLILIKYPHLASFILSVSAYTGRYHHIVSYVRHHLYITSYQYPHSAFCFHPDIVPIGRVGRVSCAPTSIRGTDGSLKGRLEATNQSCLVLRGSQVRSGSGQIWWVSQMESILMGHTYDTWGSIFFSCQGPEYFRYLKSYPQSSFLISTQ